MREKFKARTRREYAEVKNESMRMEEIVSEIEISPELQRRIEEHAKKTEWSITEAEVYAKSLIMLVKAIKLTTGTEPISLQELDQYVKDDYVGWWESSTIFQIAYGILDGINMLDYTDYDSLCMREIRLGLKEGLDISLYTGPEFFDSSKMREIRLGLKEGLDVSLYNDTRLNRETMANIRYILSLGYDEVVKKMLSITGEFLEGTWGTILGTIIKIISRYDIAPETVLEYMIDDRYNRSDLYGIANGLVKHPNVDPKLYIIPGLGFYGMMAIQEIAETAAGVNGYDDIKKTMESIRECAYDDIFGGIIGLL